MHSSAYKQIEQSNAAAWLARESEKKLHDADHHFHVYFDGGTCGQNGKCHDGYGSWEVTFNRFSKKVERQKFLAGNLKRGEKKPMLPDYEI